MAAIKGHKKRQLIRLSLLLLSAALSFFVLVLPIASRQDALPLQIGDVSTSDITSPRNESFASDVLTNKAKQDAANAITPIYLPSDPTINRAQLENLDRALDFISAVRADQYASKEQKLEDLQSIKNLAIDPDKAQNILDLTEDRWVIVKEETHRVLELVMRDNIRDYQIQEEINRIPGLVNYTLDAEENRLIQTIVSPFVIANSLFSAVETDKARQNAADLVEPVVKTYAEGQAIVLRGQVITAEQYEALEQLNLIKPEQVTEDYISAISIIFILTLFIILYFWRRKSTTLNELRSISVITICFILFLVTAKVIIPNRTIVPFFFPLPAFALILVSLFNLELSIIFPLVLSILVTFGVTNTAELPIFYIVTSLIGAIVLGKGKNFVSFIWAALSIAIAGILVIVAYRLNNPLTDLMGLITLSGTVLLNGFASASVALLLHLVLSQLLGLPTPLYLTELSRSDHPLLKYMLQNAPGTYQHSLQVANLAEQAAAAISADALLTRVGAYYHDAGKSANPAFFIENQPPGSLDSHDDMDPVIAAQTIISHVNDGVKLAEKYHLPPRLQDFIREHHGTQLTRYQYSRAIEQQKDDPSKVDAELFRYPGPQPRSKETGILMLADISEARARSAPPKNDEELRDLLKSIFDFIHKEGSLADTNLTLKDLSMIQESFHKTLKNTYHPRIQYPEDRASAMHKQKLL